MKFLLHYYELFTNFLWSSCKLLTNVLQTSYKFLTNFLQTSYKLLTNLLQTSYELLTTFLWAFYKLLMNFIWTWVRVLSVTFFNCYAEGHYANCRHVECHNAECRGDILEELYWTKIILRLNLRSLVNSHFDSEMSWKDFNLVLKIFPPQKQKKIFNKKKFFESTNFFRCNIIAPIYLGLYRKTFLRS